MAQKKVNYGCGPSDFEAGFDPDPTVFSGGLDRMIEIWEAHRKANKNGYGGCVVCAVKNWGSQPGTIKSTSCSPFTATCIGAMFDPDGAVGKTCNPKYHNGTKAMGSAFYSLHQGNYFNRPGTYSWFVENKWPVKDSWTYNASYGSTIFYGLGYEIDPRDMRRGDLVAINWQPGNGAHATFCWDVHLNAAGEVDCFQYLSANGRKLGKGQFSGIGVSVGTFAPQLWTKDNGDKTFTPVKSPMFKDDELHVKWGHWMTLPHVVVDDIDRKTFKFPIPENHFIDRNFKKHPSVRSCHVVRFFGFPPPDSPHGNILTGDMLATAKSKAKWPMPEPFAQGTCEIPEGRVKNAPTKKTPKTDPDPVKSAPKKPADQPKTQVVGHQLFVENALSQLFNAGWIEKDPGIPDNVADSQSKAALKDFQQKWKIDSHGSADKKTRDALEQALDDMQAGKPNPHKPEPPKPVLETAYWIGNKVEPGGTATFAVQGVHLDEIKSYEITLTDKKSGASQKVTARIAASGGHGTEDITVPESFKDGAQLTAKVHGTGANGDVDKALKHILYVSAPKEEPDWEWDDKKWPNELQDIVKQLRLTQKPQGPFEPRKITTYGVWDRMTDGDTPVLDSKGKTIGHVDKKCLYLADLAATMRLDGRILNLVSSGNVFDPTSGKATFDKFNPKKSKWVDVTSKAPWGMGARMPLVPFRTIAINGAKEKNLYGKKVFISELAGMTLPTGETHNGMCIIGDAGGVEPGKQLDLFVGVDGNSIGLPAVCNVEILS